MVSNFSDFSQISNVWNSGYRSLQDNPPSQMNRRRRTPGTPSPTPEADQVTGGYTGHDEQSAMRMMAREGAVPYLLTQTVPEIARSLINAMNSGDTDSARTYGARLEAINSEHGSALGMWANTGRDESLAPGRQRSALGTLRFAARALSMGSWKSDVSVLNSLAGAETKQGVNYPVYNDFINYDSPESVANRRNNYINNWGLKASTAELLATRTPENLAARELFEPLFSARASSTDSSDVQTLKAKARVLEQMNEYRNAAGWTEEDPTGFNDMVRAFFGSDPKSNAIPNIKSFRQCVTAYNKKSGYTPLEYADRWNKAASQAATQIATTRNIGGAAAVDVPTDVTSTQDVQRSDAVLLELEKLGYDRFDPKVGKLVNKVVTNWRNLGVDLSEAGVENPAQKMAHYANYLAKGMSSVELSDPAKEIVNVISDAQTLRARMRVSEPSLVPGPDGRLVVDPAEAVKPLTNEYSSFEQALVNDLLVPITEKFIKARVSGVDVTHGDIVQCIANSTSPIVAEVKRLTNDEENTEALTKLADYFYPLVTGNYAGANGEALPRWNNFRDFVNVQLRKSHEIRKDGKVAPIAPMPASIVTLPRKVGPVSPGTSTESAPITFDTLSLIQSDPERYFGDVPENVVSAVKELTNQYTRFQSSTEQHGSKPGDSHYIRRKEKTTDVAGTKLITQLAATDLGLSDKLAKKMGDANQALTAVLRGQRDITEPHKSGRKSGISADEMSAVSQGYSDVLDICKTLLDTPVGDEGSVQQLKRVSLAQEILGKLAPLTAELSKTYGVGVPVTGLMYGRPQPYQTQRPGTEELRSDFLKVAKMAGPVFEARVKKVFSDIDHGMSTDEAWATNFSDETRKVLDGELQRINPDYRGSYLASIGAKLGPDGFNGTDLLVSLNNRAVKGAEAVAEAEHAKQTAISNDKTRQVWDRVFHNLMDMNTAQRVIFDAAQDRAKTLASMHGNSFDQKDFVARFVTTARQKLDNAGGQDLTSVVRGMLDRLGAFKPYFYLADASGKAIPLAAAHKGNGDVMPGVHVSYISATDDDEFLKLALGGQDPKSPAYNQLRNELISTQAQLSTQYRRERELKAYSEKIAEKEKIEAQMDD